MVAQNSSPRVDYKVIDDFPYSGVSYYRLKQLNLNNSFTYSVIQEVRLDRFQGENQISFYPNPSSDFLNVRFAKNQAPSLIKIINTQGKVLLSKSIEPSISEPIPINLKSLTRGTYFLQVVLDNGSIHSYSFVKM